MRVTIYTKGGGRYWFQGVAVKEAGDWLEVGFWQFRRSDIRLITYSMKGGR